jgi:DNA-binding transcriptional regulator YdaS (Cro superfamily)
MVSGRKRREENAVARAVRLIGGPTKAATLCGVSNTAIHDWINKGNVSLLKHALRLSRASGIPIEEFVGEDEAAG